MLLIQTATRFAYPCASIIIIITMFCYCCVYWRFIEAWTYLSSVMSQHSQLPCLFCFVVVFVQFYVSVHFFILVCMLHYCK
jgi:hypothetical protein